MGALTAPKPIVASRAGLAVATVSDFEEETPAFIQTVSDLGITAMRLGTCALMEHHGFDKIQNVDGFSANVVAKFFGFLLGLGVFARPTSLAMSATMITAVVFHLLNTGGEDFPLGIPKAHSYNFELAAMYVLVLGYFSVSGAGKYSVDELVLGGELNFYAGLFDKVTGGNQEEE